MKKFELSQESEITFKDVQRNGGFPYLGKPRDYDRAIEELSVSPEVKGQLKQLVVGRDRYHLLRLFSSGRSEAEQRFAVDYLENIDKVRDLLRADPERRAKISGVIGSEGDDTCVWWTLGPYLHQELKRRGFSGEEALTRVVEWAEDGSSVATSERSGQWNSVHLKGAEDFNQHRPSIYKLGDNPSGSSHRFTESRAKEIVDKILLKVQKSS